MGLFAALKGAPWEAIKSGIRAFRVNYASSSFDTDRVSSAIVTEPDSIEAVERGLRERRFEGTYLAYYYDGERLNMRRPEPPEKGGPPMELHVRAFDHEDGIELVAHHEASRYEAKNDHINEVGLSWSKGREMLSAELEVLGWEYRYEDPDP